MIEARNLKFSYGKERLFEDLNLTVEVGNIYGLLGKNGAGKTTLLNLLAGLLRPLKGSISVMGQVPRKRSPDFLSKVIYVPEKLHIPPMTIKTYEEVYKVFIQILILKISISTYQNLELKEIRELILCLMGSRKNFF